MLKGLIQVARSVEDAVSSYRSSSFKLSRNSSSCRSLRFSLLSDLPSACSSLVVRIQISQLHEVTNRSAEATEPVQSALSDKNRINPLSSAIFTAD